MAAAPVEGLAAAVPEALAEVELAGEELAAWAL